MKTYFDDFDFTEFWSNNNQEEVSGISDEAVKLIEAELGFKLPDSYIEFMKMFNGGNPNKSSVVAPEQPLVNKEDEDYDEEDDMSGCYINFYEFLSLNEIAHETEFMKNEWGYPDIGVYICRTGSGGHDIIMLDYGKYAKNNEPAVVYVDQEDDYAITLLAENFEEFIKNLIE